MKYYSINIKRSRGTGPKTLRQPTYWHGGNTRIDGGELLVCTNCNEEKTDVSLKAGQLICTRCMQDRYAKALSNYVIAMSEEVVSTPYGWATALCALEQPVEWLCKHIHNTRSSAQECLADTLSNGGGIFPIR